MSLGSAKIIATPSKISELGALPEMGVEVQASPSSPRREEDYTYTYNFGTRKQGKKLNLLPVLINLMNYSVSIIKRHQKNIISNLMSKRTLLRDIYRAKTSLKFL